MSQQNSWIVIAAYNESRVISTVVKEVVAANYRVVVVDDSSSDNTGALAVEAGADVCRHLVNLGQGAALQTGIDYALRNGADFIVTFDADGQHLAAEIARMLEPLKRGGFDVALGSRFLKAGSAVGIPLTKRWVLALATAFTRITSRIQVTDTHNGFRAFTAAAARKIRITQNRMSHASQILSEISRLQLQYVEIPVTIIYTEYSKQKGQRLSGSLNILWDLFTERLK